MTVLEQRMYRNPLDILIEGEARTCKGCKHQHTATLWGKEITICKKVMPNGKRRNHGKKCKDYLETK